MFFSFHVRGRVRKAKRNNNYAKGTMAPMLLCSMGGVCKDGCS